MNPEQANRLFQASLLAFAAVSAAAAAGLLYPLDRWLLGLAQTRPAEVLDRAGAFFSTLGDVEYTVPAFVALALTLYLRGRRSLAWRLLAAFAVTGIIELAMKLWLPTPPMPEETARSTDPNPVVEIDYAYPYPSGHMLRLTLLTCLIYALWPNRVVRTILLLLLAGMAATRVYLGVHWASDLLGGALLGVAGIAWTLRKKGVAAE